VDHIVDFFGGRAPISIMASKARSDSTRRRNSTGLAPHPIAYLVLGRRGFDDSLGNDTWQRWQAALISGFHKRDVGAGAVAIGTIAGIFHQPVAGDTVPLADDRAGLDDDDIDAELPAGLRLRDVFQRAPDARRTNYPRRLKSGRCFRSRWR
jgi:hypothetical protein